MNDLNKIIMSGEAEITDASTCQICIHLGNDRFIYMEPATLSPGDNYPEAASIIRKAKRNELTPADSEKFRIEEIEFEHVTELAKKNIIDAYGIGKPENYTPEFYKQLIVEGAFELGYL